MEYLGALFHFNGKKTNLLFKYLIGRNFNNTRCDNKNTEKDNSRYVSTIALINCIRGADSLLIQNCTHARIQ